MSPRFGEQRENRIHHRRINRAQTFAAFEAFQHPFARASEAHFAKWLPGRTLVELQTAVEREKDIPPGENTACPRRTRAVSAPEL